MATKKKPTDPTEAALSAIEEALGMVPEAQTQSGEQAGASAPPEDIDIFAETTPPARASHEPPPLEMGPPPLPEPQATPPALTPPALPEPEPAPAAELPVLPPLPIFPPRSAAANTSEEPAEAEKPRKSAAPAKPGIKPARSAEEAEPAAVAAPTEPVVEAPRVTPRANAIPANDDRRANVAALLAPLQAPSPKGPLVWAFIASALWLGAAGYVASRPEGMLLGADGALRPGVEGTLALVVLAALLPVLFFFSLAALQRRSRELKTSAQVMAEVAARLAEPEVAGAETVFTLGQAVRREVTSIGDGIERAVGRAGELESLVHGEVSALERSYADNEYKMRALVTELAAEREAIMATAERIRLTIDAAHQGFSADIEKAAGSITSAVDEAGGRVHSLMGEKQTLLVSSLETSAAMIGQLMDERSRDLSDRLHMISGEAVSGVENARSDLIAQINQTGASLVAELNRTTANVGTTLNEQAQSVRLSLEEATQGVTQSFRDQTQAATGEITLTLTQATEAFRAAGSGLKAEFDESAQVVTSAFEANGHAIMEQVGARAIEINDAMRQVAGDLIDAMENRGVESAKLIEEKGGRLAQDISERAEALVGSVLERTEHLDGALRDHTSALETRLAEQGATLAEMITARIEQANEAFGIAGESLASLITERSLAASGGLKEELDGLAASLKTQAQDASEGLALAGREVVAAIAAQGGRVNEALSANAVRLAETVAERTGGLAGHFEGFEAEFRAKSEALEKTVTTQSEHLTGTLESLLGRIESGLDERAKSLADSLALRTLDISRTLGESGKELVDALEGKVEIFSSRVVEPLGAHVEAIDTKVDQTAARLSAQMEAFDRRAGESADALSVRIERSADALALRTGEIERALAAIGNEVGSELMAKADDLARRITGTLAELDAAISTGSGAAFNAMAQTGEKLRSDVNDLLTRLTQTNMALAGVVSGAQANLGEVESKMAERVRGLESTLAAVLSASREGTDVLVAKVEAIRNATGDVLGQSETMARELEARTEALKTLNTELSGTQGQVSRLLAERQQAFEGLAGTLSARVEDIDNMLRSFTALVDEQLETAQSKAREAASLVHDSAESAANAIGTQYERVRIESGKERERTSASLRAAYEQANTEMSTLFARTLEGFSATAAQFRQAAGEVQRDLEGARQALAAGGLEIPREAREVSANLKRVVADQMRALNELTSIVSRSGAGLDVAEPRAPERAPAPARVAPPPAVEPAAPRIDTRTRPVAPAAPRAGGTWLSGLLERAGDEPAPPARPRAPEPASAARIESLDSLSVDIARMIDHQAAVELWDRYRRGERNVFTRRLYTLQGQEAYDDIRRRYRRDAEFARTVDAYIDQFERLLGEVAPDDRDGVVARTYLTSETGKVYTMLAHAAGRFD